MKRLLWCAFFCFVVLCAVRGGAQTTIHVPADQPTIQAGINAAGIGDTVLVAPGTYFENIDFKGKSITVTSSGGAANTILDGGNAASPGVFFGNLEPRGSTFSGFTVRKGTTGVRIQNATPTIKNNIITGNLCSGVSIQSAGPAIQANQIDSNGFEPRKASCSPMGAGIEMTGNGNSLNVETEIVGNTIQNNTGGMIANGVGINASLRVLIQGNTIRNNVGTKSAFNGGIGAITDQPLYILQNLIYGNAGAGPYDYAGGISVQPMAVGVGAFSGVIAGNTIAENSLASYVQYESAEEVIVSGNLSQYVIVNNVVVSSNATIPAFNCEQVTYGNATPLVFDHNDIYNAKGPAYGEHCPDQTGIYGNLSADPGFINPGGGDFHLRAGSPAMDAGNNSAPMMAANDIEGNTRIQDARGVGYPVVDMGAYEFSGALDAAPTVLTLTPSTYYFSPNQLQFTLAVAATSTVGVPTGMVTIYEDQKAIGSVNLSGGGASLQISRTTPGVHEFVAIYSGQGSFPPAVSVKFYIFFPLYVPTLTITSSSNPSLLGSPVTLTVNASSPEGTVPSPITLTDQIYAVILATLTPDASGVATYTTSTLKLGDHEIIATYSGNATNNTATAMLDQQVIAGYVTATTLNSAPNPSTHGQNVTFTAHVTASLGGSPTGSVVFTENQTTLATVPVDGAGNAGFSTNSLTATHSGSGGAHLIVASYVPTGEFSASQGTVSQTVNGLPTTNTLTISPTSGTTNTVYTMTAVVASATSSSTVAPTGTVLFYANAAAGGNSTLLGNAALTNGVAVLASSALSGGMDYVSAYYLGDATYAESTSNIVPLVVMYPPTALTLSSSANPSPALTPIVFTAQLTVEGHAGPAGVPLTLTLVNGPSVALITDATGTATYSVAGLAPGPYPVSVSFAGNSSLKASSGSLNEVITANATATTLTGTPNPAYQNQPVTLGFSVTAMAGTATPMGTVTILDGGVAIGTFALAPSGTAKIAAGTFTTSTLAVGTHTLVAVYGPDSTAFVTSQSSALSLTVLQQDFTITTASPAISIQTGHHTSLMLNVASVGNFNGPVALSCGAPLPEWLTCQLSASQVALPANGTVPVTLKLDTDAVLGFKAAKDARGPGGGVALAWVGLLPWFALMACRKKRVLSGLLLLGLCVGVGASLTGCSGKYPASVTPGTYTVPIVATGQTAGSSVTVSHTLNVTLTVTP